jgi:hypothetical protein
MGRKQKNRRLKLKYAVLGEGITEQWYLQHLKEHENFVYAIRPSLFTDVSIEKAEGIIDELVTGGCDHITFLTDYDTIVSQGKQKVFESIKNKYSDNDNVLICESMPAIELWFLLHFVYTTKEFTNCAQVIKDLKNYLPEYEKKKTYLEKIDWFNEMIKDGGNENALKNARKLLKELEKGHTGEHFPYTKMPKAIKAFEKQKKDTG